MRLFLSSRRLCDRGTHTALEVQAHHPMSSTRRSPRWFPAFLAFQTPWQQRQLCHRSSRHPSSQSFFLLLNVWLLGKSSLLSCRQRALWHRPNSSFKADGYAAA